MYCIAAFPNRLTQIYCYKNNILDRNGSCFTVENVTLYCKVNLNRKFSIIIPPQFWS
jgi:hypothetical protein